MNLAPVHIKALAARARGEIGDGPARLAINVANAAVAQIRDDGSVRGPAAEIAASLGHLLNRPVEFVHYESASAIVGATELNAWHAAFIAHDPSRTDRFAFTPPYLSITAALVSPGASMKSLEDIDRPGHIIASVSGAAFDRHLRNLIVHAEVIGCTTPTDALALLTAGRAHAAAGIRGALDVFAATWPARYVLSDDFAVMQQAIAIHRETPSLAKLLAHLVVSRTNSN